MPNMRKNIATFLIYQKKGEISGKKTEPGRTPEGL